MTKTIEKPAASLRREVVCQECGGTTFLQNVEEDASIVKLFINNGYLEDEVIKEGDRQFTYECEECNTSYEGDE